MSISRSSKAILFSAALHVFVALAMVLLTQSKPAPSQVISMEILETQPAPSAVAVTPQEQVKKRIPKKIDDTQKIVDQPDKALNDEVDEHARFLGKHNQRVEKQTVAKNRGEFQNKEKIGPQGKEGSTTPEPSNPMQKFLPQFDVAKAVQERNAREEKFAEEAESLMVKHQQEKKKDVAKAAEKGKGQDANKGSDVSQTLDYIKDLDSGLETLLSSKEFKYYTYFSRLRKQINQHWAPKVRQKVTQVYRQGRKIASSDDMITRCLVTLDKNGILVKVQIIGNSGLIELDEAAVEAFRAAAPFPNPPRGMVDSDGMIKIRWDFILEA